MSSWGQPVQEAAPGEYGPWDDNPRPSTLLLQGQSWEEGPVPSS